MVKSIIFRFFVVLFSVVLFPNKYNAFVITSPVEMIYIRGGDKECNNRFGFPTEPGDPPLLLAGVQKENPVLGTNVKMIMSKILLIQCVHIMKVGIVGRLLRQIK